MPICVALGAQTVSATDANADFSEYFDVGTASIALPISSTTASKPACMFHQRLICHHAMLASLFAKPKLSDADRARCWQSRSRCRSGCRCNGVLMLRFGRTQFVQRSKSMTKHPAADGQNLKPHQLRFVAFRS